MNDPRRRQARFNAGSRGQWSGFEGHRREVSALLGPEGRPGISRLCVLGAGNGNDLDLPALLASHREVHLVDLDPTALDHAAGHQAVAGTPALRCFGGLDLTGLLDAIAGWSPTTPIGPRDLEALVEWPARRVGLALPGPYDVVASTCLLSPLIGNASVALGERHPRFEAVVGAIRLGHLRLLAGLTAPGGTSVLISDVTSTDHHPTLASAPDASLPSLLARLCREGGLIRGVNPAEVIAAIRGDPALSARVAGLEPVRPWRWRLFAREYLVWAVRCRFGASAPRR